MNYGPNTPRSGPIPVAAGLGIDPSMFDESVPVAAAFPIPPVQGSARAARGAARRPARSARSGTTTDEAAAGGFTTGTYESMAAPETAAPVSLHGMIERLATATGIPAAAGQDADRSLYADGYNALVGKVAEGKLLLLSSYF